MKRVLFLALLISVSVCAAPGGNSGKQPAQGALMMVDAVGKELGPAIPKDTEQFSEWIVGAYIRYGDDTFAIRFHGDGLVREFVPRASTIYFTGPGCTGGSYISLAEVLKFTPRAALVAYVPRSGMPPGQYLFATAPQEFQTIRITYQGTFSANNGCVDGGGSADLVPVYFVVDLTTVFQPPYSLK